MAADRWKRTDARDAELFVHRQVSWPTATPVYAGFRSNESEYVRGVICGVAVEWFSATDDWPELSDGMSRERL